MSSSFRIRIPLASRGVEYQPLPISTPVSPTRLPRRNRWTLLAFCTLITVILLVITRPTPQALRLREYGNHSVWVEKVKQWTGADSCKGWDPDLPEDEDPEGCMRARQYRQTIRVLEREERAEHQHWYFTLAHNRETFRNVSRCFLPTWHTNYTRCIDKPLIISGWWYTAETLTGATTGEVIWQSSVVKQLAALGMHCAAVGPYENWVEVAEMMPDVYRFIWIPDVDIVSCATDPRCVAKEHYVPPDDAEDLSVGVPEEERGTISLWQMLVVDYWGARPNSMANSDFYFGPNTLDGWSYQPLGTEWIATPWPLPGGHFHLPYSIEEWCMPLPVKPHAERNDSVLLFAKRSGYFTWPNVPDQQFFTNLSRSTEFDLVLTAKLEDGFPLPEGLTTLGPQTRERYEELVGESKVLLGMGQPRISPSVYTALCQATPVVLPYLVATPLLDGWDLYGSSSQHGPAALLGPPYVYSYYKSNYSSLVEAVHQAFTTPIERFIPDDMKLDYALQKTQEYLDRDLRGMFDKVVRGNDGWVPPLAAGIRERCYELNRCRPMIAPGTVKVPTKGGGHVRTYK